MTTRLIRRWQYAYDAGGNIGSKTTEVYDPPGNRVQAWTAAYGYDGIDQLTGVQYTGQVPAGLVNEWYAYDAVGNRVASYLSGAYVYNELNQLTEDADWVYGYDADGNLVERVCRGTGSRCEAGERWVMDYDAENTLRRVQKWVGGALALEVAYVYDPLGRRIERRVVDGAQGTTAIGQYLYRDEDVVAEFRVDLTTGSRVLEKLYFHGDLGVDDPVAMFRCVGSDCRGDYQWYFYGKDHLNTVEALWDSGTRPAASYAYSAFGLPTAPPSPLQPFTFTGREWDPTLGLYDYRARWYDAGTGRFLSEDPWWFQRHADRASENVPPIARQGWPWFSLNLYRYVYNHPDFQPDPFGMNLYGHYCGPFNPPKGVEPSPIDDVDGCCRRHDEAYERAGASTGDNIVGIWDCQKCAKVRKADEDMCFCVFTARRKSALHWIGSIAVQGWACCLTVMPCVPLRGIICAHVYPFTNP
jgi:RHS repeat-associated protein